MRKTFVVFFTMLFSFCSKKESNSYPRIIIPKSKSAVQVNTKTMLHTRFERYDCFFAGNFTTDTIIDQKYQTSEKELKKFKWDTSFPRYDFKIIIDTSYTIDAKGFEYRNVGINQNGRIDFGKVFALWEDYVVCYPLLIYNNGNKPAYSNDYFKFIQEAKNSEGKWKPIEFFANIPSCIPNPFFYEYMPKKYSSLSIIKYHGDFKTKIRVKIKIGNHTYYSNEIEGHINKTQFDKETARETMKFLCHLCGGTRPVSEELLSYVFLQDEDLP